MSKVKAWTCSTAWNDEKDSVPVQIYTDKSKAEKMPCLKYDDGHCYLVELEITAVSPGDVNAGGLDKQ